VGSERSEASGKSRHFLYGAEQAEEGTTGSGSVELQWRNCFGWGRKWKGVMGSPGDERAVAPIHFCHERGGGAARGRRAGYGGARPGGGGLAFGWRKEKGSWAERLRRPVGQLGRCEGFGAGEKGGFGGLRWAKKSARRGPVWEFARKTHIGLPRPTGRIEEMNMKGP
jgi:hypothetical protein